MLHRLSTLALALLAAAPAFAGSQIDSKKSVLTPALAVPLTLVRLESSYTFESDFHRGRDASGDAWTNSFEVSHRFPIQLPWLNAPDSGWFFRVGAGYDRHDFDNSGALPLPNHLQSFNATFALEYLRRGETGFLLQTKPGFYFEDDVDGDSFDAPTILALAFPVTDRVILVGGVAYSALRTYPFLPVVGVVWKISDQWKLTALIPEPRLTYFASDRLAFWVGGELAGGSFRTDDDASRKGELRSAVLTYSEYRGGAGVTYGNPDRCAVELGGGYTFKRKFDYHRADETYNTDGAPFVKVSFRAGF